MSDFFLPTIVLQRIFSYLRAEERVRARRVCRRWRQVVEETRIWPLAQLGFSIGCPELEVLYCRYPLYTHSIMYIIRYNMKKLTIRTISCCRRKGCAWNTSALSARSTMMPSPACFTQTHVSWRFTVNNYDISTISKK